jgi:hypothetical protein
LVYPAGYSQLIPDAVVNPVEKTPTCLPDSQACAHVDKWVWMERAEIEFREIPKIENSFLTGLFKNDLGIGQGCVRVMMPAWD